MEVLGKFKKRIFQMSMHPLFVFSNNVREFSYLVEFVLLAELYTLSPAVVALVQVGGYTSKLNQFMFL